MFPQDPTKRLTLASLLIATAVAGVTPTRAADLDRSSRAPLATEGVDCAAPEVQTFPGVMLGHFEGGASVYTGPGGSILLDWRDERLCFPTRRSCERWVSAMRREFHHPEGYFTCLTIR